MWRSLQMMGLILPWFGPLVGLFVISPLIEMGLAESRQLTAETQCLKESVNVCDSVSQFDYYFWNITNPDQVRCGHVADADAGGNIHSAASSTPKVLRECQTLARGTCVGSFSAVHGGIGSPSAR